jgi:hypothetical protein
MMGIDATLTAVPGPAAELTPEQEELRARAASWTTY